MDRAGTRDARTAISVEGPPPPEVGWEEGASEMLRLWGDSPVVHSVVDGGTRDDDDGDH